MCRKEQENNKGRMIWITILIILWLSLIFVMMVVIPDKIYNRGIREVIHLFTTNEGSSYYLASYEGIWPDHYLEDNGEKYDFIIDQARCDHYIYRVEGFAPTEDTKVVYKMTLPFVKEIHLPVYPAGTMYERIQLSEEFDEYYEETDDPEGNFIAYLDHLSDTDYRIYMLIQDEGTIALTDEILESLSELGVKTDLRDKYRASYIGVFQNGRSEYEDLSLDTTLYHEDGEFKMMSSGSGAGFSVGALWIDGHVVSKMQRGLNIVVYDSKSNTIVDSCAVDTYEGLTMSRLQ